MRRGQNGKGDPVTRSAKGARRPSRFAITLAVSILLHIGIIALLVPYTSMRIPGNSADEDGVILVTTENARPGPVKTLERPRKTRTKARREPTRPAGRTRNAPVAPSVQETERPATNVGDQPAATALADDAPSDSTDDGIGHYTGQASGQSTGFNLRAGLGTLAGSVDPSPECLDGLDNDGDYLVDSEDPGCRISTTPEEDMSHQLGATLLSDLRRGSVRRGDPDELAHKRVQTRLRYVGDSIRYDGGLLQASIGPDGSVHFGGDRGIGAGSGGFSFDSTPRSRRNLAQKRRFMEATEELRDELAVAANERAMNKALFGLRASLDRVWRDERYSLRQKKTILFQRLDECAMDTEDGRQAAQVIVEFIRNHTRPARPRGAKQASLDEPPPAAPPPTATATVD